MRRIQELTIDPVLSVQGAGGSGNPGLQQAAGQAAGSGEGAPGADPQTATTKVEGAQTTPAVIALPIKREYVWGPGDKGVDELWVQYDAYRIPWWMVTDEGGDVVALGGRGSSSGTTVFKPAARWTYDACTTHMSLRCM